MRWVAELGGRTLQVACVYGDFTPRLAERVAAGGGTLDVVDVLPIQLENLAAKLKGAPSVRLRVLDRRCACSRPAHRSSSSTITVRPAGTLCAA